MRISNEFVGMMEGEGNWIEVVQNYSGHWALRDQQQHAFIQDLEHPAEETLYFHMDMADRISDGPDFLLHTPLDKTM